MILPSTLHKAFTSLNPNITSSTERKARNFLEKNPIIADCCDLKFATNMYRKYLGV